LLRVLLFEIAAPPLHASPQHVETVESVKSYIPLHGEQCLILQNQFLVLGTPKALAEMLEELLAFSEGVLELTVQHEHGDNKHGKCPQDPDPLKLTPLQNEGLVFPEVLQAQLVLTFRVCFGGQCEPFFAFSALVIRIRLLRIIGLLKLCLLAHFL
jgi:hypothetical protein